MSNKRQWNKIAKKYSELVSRSDDSVYHKKLVPLVIKMIQDYSIGKKVLDVGCGDGYLSNLLDERGYEVLGVDVSGELIKIAKSRYKNPKFLQMNASKIEEHLEDQYKIIVSNFSLHSMADKEARGFLASTKRLLGKNGLLVFSIAHPCFYLKSSQDYFVGKSKNLMIDDYKKKSIFKKNIGYGVYCKHFHRSLSWYFGTCFRLGYECIDFREVFDVSDSIFRSIPFGVVLVFRYDRS